MTRPARSVSAARAVPSSTRSTVATASTAKSRGKRPAGADPAESSPAQPHPAKPARPVLPGGYIPPPPSTTPAPEFSVGDKAVHPAHGVGEVTAIEQREIGGTRTVFYILRILDNGMKVMVPRSAATQVGLRAIM